MCLNMGFIQCWPERHERALVADFLVLPLLQMCLSLPVEDLRLDYELCTSSRDESDRYFVLPLSGLLGHVLVVQVWPSSCILF